MIDIIIPVYNASKTLFNTLLSICMQDKKEKINVYIIDDNSQCNYDKIINKFKLKLNINYYKLKENSGAGVARQYGIDCSNSDYIMFIDADDILPNCEVIELFLQKLVLHPDVIVGYIYDEKKKQKIKNSDGCLHGKCYRRKFIESKNIKFSNRRIHEDNEFNKKVRLNTPKIQFIDEVVYIYKFTANSLTNSISDNNKNINDYISMILDVVKYALENNIDYDVISNFLKERKNYLDSLKIIDVNQQLSELYDKYNIKET